MQILPLDQNEFKKDSYNEKLDYIIFYFKSIMYVNLRDKEVYGYTKLSDKELLKEYLKLCNEKDVKDLLELMLLLITLLQGKEVEISHREDCSSTIVKNNRAYILCKYDSNPLYIYDKDGDLKRIELGFRCTNRILVESLFNEIVRGFIKGNERKVLKK